MMLYPSIFQVAARMIIRTATEGVVIQLMGEMFNNLKSS